MSAPRRITRQGQYCLICGGTEYYEFSMKCCNCVRKVAAKTTVETRKKKKKNNPSYGMQTKPIKTDTDKENRFMDGVTYD